MNEKGLHDIEQYTACVIFYATDLACNKVKDCASFIDKQDKETKRIWWALYKRYKNYFYESGKVQGNGVRFIAHFSEIMDDKVDSCLDSLTEYIERELEAKCIEDYEFIAHVEVARICVQFAVNVTNSMIRIMEERKIKTELSHVFDLTEMLDIINNFYYWITRKIDIQVGVDSEKLLTSIRTLYSSIMEYNNFVEAYKYAIKEEESYESKD